VFTGTLVCDEAIRAALYYARTGIVGAVMLGFGRALGETMAVTMVIGNNPRISTSLFAPQYTMAAVIANEFTEAADNLYLSALVEIGLVLFVVTLIVNSLSRLLIWSMSARTQASSRAQWIGFVGSLGEFWSKPSRSWQSACPRLSCNRNFALLRLRCATEPVRSSSKCRVSFSDSSPLNRRLTSILAGKGFVREYGRAATVAVVSVIAAFFSGDL